MLVERHRMTMRVIGRRHDRDASTAADRLELGDRELDEVRMRRVASYVHGDRIRRIQLSGGDDRDVAMVRADGSSSIARVGRARPRVVALAAADRYRRRAEYRERPFDGELTSCQKILVRHDSSFSPLRSTTPSGTVP